MTVLVHAPYRLSFMGGGSDYPAHYEKYGGAVMSATINRYCRVAVRELPPFFDHRYQVVWSQIERVGTVAEIQHPLVREVLSQSWDTWASECDDAPGLSIVHDGDLPARSGLGASAAFAVAFIAAMRALRAPGQSALTRTELALAAIAAERNISGDNVGVQDQIASTYGGFNRINIEKDGRFRVMPLLLGPATLERLESRLLLFYTGMQRDAATVAAEQVENMRAGETSGELRALAEMVDEAAILLARGRLDAFGCLLHEGWMLKRRLGSGVSTPQVDQLYSRALAAGALGGKLLGAGGGGFLLVYAPEGAQTVVRQALGELVHVLFRFEHDGCRIIHAEAPPA